MRARRRLRTLALTVLVPLLLATGCFSAPGDVTQIEWVSTTTVNGWRYDFYRNRAYPCSISGHHTFLVGRKVGSSDTTASPLWVKLRGGGFGYFAPGGVPMPSGANMREESQSSLLGQVDPTLMAKVMAAPEGFRVLVVSMCNHDLYSGSDTPDANNPNLDATGQPLRTNGLAATRAAITYTQSSLPTSDTFLHGNSAGGFGVLTVGWSMELGNVPATGIVSDSGVLNQRYQQGQVDQGLPCALTEEQITGITGRVHPAVVDVANQPDLLVSRGELSTPIFHIYSRSDPNVCGDVPMQCTLADGSTISTTSAICNHEPLRRAIEAQGPTSRSESLRVCVDNTGQAGTCDMHVVTNRNIPSTEPGGPSDYNAAILEWARARLADA